MKMEWFHGDISRKETSNIVLNSGVFLVRFNLGERESIRDFPFTISRVNKNGGLDHIRVGRDNSNCLYVDMKTKEGVRRITSNCVDELIDSVKNSLFLKTAAGGRKYFRETSNIGYYDQSDSADEANNQNQNDNNNN